MNGLLNYTPEQLNRLGLLAQQDLTTGTINPSNPSMVDKAQGLLAQGFMKMGYNPRDAYAQANKWISTQGDMGAADFVPLAGDLIGAQDAYDMGGEAKNAFNREEYLKALGYGAGSAATGILSGIGALATVAPPLDKGIDAARVGVKKATGLLDDNVRAVDPMAEKAMAEHFRNNRQANIKKVLTSGRNASPNFFDDETAKQLAFDIRKKQASRDATYGGLLNTEGRYLRNDSGNLPYSTQNKLNKFKAKKLVNDAAKRLNWNKGLIKDIMTEESYLAPDAYRFYTNKKATDATIEAIERAAKKRGWKVAYRSGRATKGGSRYIEVPEKGQIRVSDHELPDTPRRSDIMQNKGYDWVDELVVGNEWKTRTIEDYLNEIEGLASQE
jgi:hypothetical protein